MLRDVYLHGSLGETFGEKYRLDVKSLPEAVRALEANFPGFAHHIKAGNWYLSYGDHDKDQGMCLNEETMRLNLGDGPIHFIPEAIGMGGGQRGKGGIMVVVGVVIAAVAIVASYGAATPGVAAAGGAGAGAGAGAATGLGAIAFANISYGTIALFGASLALSGIATLISPVPEAPGAALERENPEDRASFLFNGAVNTVEQGGPVPIVYGKHIVGSKVISGGIAVEDVS
jgi:predicted phage tail protein